MTKLEIRDLHVSVEDKPILDRLKAAFDGLHAAIDNVLTASQKAWACPVGLEDQGDAARGLAPHRDDLGPGVSRGPSRGDQLGVPVHAMGPGQQVDQR